MSYVIAEPCIGVCERACVEVCPVDCIHGEGYPKYTRGDNLEAHQLAGLQMYIDPDMCIECGSCEPECPTGAIFQEEELPTRWLHYLEKNAAFFVGKH
jgi:NAD-dependent dihydropyrimidine dehydrogenase PreA subunit